MVGFDHDRNVPVSNTFLAGFFGGIVTRALVSPLDVIKIRFQVSKSIGTELLFNRYMYILFSNWELFPDWFLTWK